jgi:hypothetical protein
MWIFWKKNHYHHHIKCLIVTDAYGEHKHIKFLLKVSNNKAETTA